MNKQYIRKILGYSILGYFIFSGCYFLLAEHRPTYSDCGIIISKSNDEVAIKHGTRTELYLNIQFEQSGFRSIETEPTTYFQFQKGERVCFNLKKKMPTYHYVFLFSGLCTIVFLFMWLTLELIALLIGAKGPYSSLIDPD